MRRASHFLALGAAVVGGAALAQPAGQKVTGPIATYWVSAQTQTGMGMPAMGGGGRPSGAQIMNMMRGGGGAQHILTLQLGSSEAPKGEPEAEHLPPEGLGVGPSLPLVTPRAQPTQKVDEEPGPPREFQRPHGRMLIFWGCGEHARQGQPLVIDFSKLEPGQIPPGFMAVMHGLGHTPMQPPSPTRNKTYGEWPNERSRAAVPPTGSLVGEHVVKGDYSPEIRFTLSPSQDFLAPLHLVRNERTPSGAVQLGWNPVPSSEGYLAVALGGGQDQVVVWSSSEVQATFFPPDYISPSDARRLVASHALMSPQTTACLVPKEVTDAAQHAFLQMVAYGGEADFGYPPRPSDPKIAWNRQWNVKVRYRSATGGLLGMTMPGMMGGDEDGEGPPDRARAQRPSEQPKRKRPGLGGILGGALGIPVPPQD